MSSKHLPCGRFRENEERHVEASKAVVPAALVFVNGSVEKLAIAAVLSRSGRNFTGRKKLRANNFLRFDLESQSGAKSKIGPSFCGGGACHYITTCRYDE